MIRHLLPRSRPFLLLALWSLAAAAAGSAAAQDRSTQERLDRLERDLSMLQRQVYRGGGMPAAAATATSPSTRRSGWTGSKRRCAN